MEPNKLEKEFREKLGKRTIQPSEMAWDRLDAMLSVAEKKKKPNRAWMYMAASFLVFATLGVLFLGKGESNEAIQQDAVVTSGQPVPVSPTPETETIKPGVVVKEEAQVAEVKQPAQANKKRQRIATKTATLQNIPADNQAIAQVSTQEPAGIIAEQEAEILVAQAIAQETTPKNKPKVTVDPNTLLSSVEGELDENFRDKAFQGVIKNFNAVKTAVANRNYQ